MKKFSVGDKIRLVGDSWGGPGTWSEPHMGKDLVLVDVGYVRGEPYYFRTSEDPDDDDVWYFAPGYEIDHAPTD